jgi:hypothetical protein
MGLKSHVRTFVTGVCSGGFQRTHMSQQHWLSLELFIAAVQVGWDSAGEPYWPVTATMPMNCTAAAPKLQPAAIAHGVSAALFATHSPPDSR